MVRVRFAPSPTGYVHIGSMRTALFNFLYARKQEGDYVLRVEDTDRTRLVEGAIEGMLKSLQWVGIDHNEGVLLDEEDHVVQAGSYGPYIQSERLHIYRKYVDQLIASGDAYYCFCSKDRLDEVRKQQKIEGKIPRYDGHCRGLTPEEIQRKIEAGETYTVRLKLPPDYEISFEDAVRGRVTINTNDMDDQVLLKTDGYPTYHMAVVVDDYLMKITHIIRGEEWLPSTPKHVYLYQVLHWEMPEFVHLPNILNSDRKKLSKRQGDVAVEDFQINGYLPEALINYIALLGWSPEDNEEIFSMEELIQRFSLDRISKSGAVFDVNKLKWVNNQYIKSYDPEKLLALAQSYLVSGKLMTWEECKEKHAWLLLALETVRESMDTLAEFPEKIIGLLSDDIEIYEGNALEFMKEPHIPDLLQQLIDRIGGMDFIEENDVKKMLKDITKDTGIKGKNLFMGTRVLLTGQMHGPELPRIMELLGKEKVQKRLQQSKEYI